MLKSARADSELAVGFRTRISKLHPNANRLLGSRALANLYLARRRLLRVQGA